MNYGPTGRDGRWPHVHAIKTFMRHWQNATPTIRETAVHEAAHVVVAHELGILSQHATAQPPGNTIALKVFGRVLVPESYFDSYSYEERILIQLAGRAADERQGCFCPLSFMIGGDEDEHQALTLAALCAGHNPAATAEILTSLKRKAKVMVESAWPDILRVAAELEVGDLNSADFERILGPPPPLTYVERTAAGHVGVGETFSDEIVLAAIGALLEGLPYGLACIQMIDGQDAFLWKSDVRDGLMVTVNGETQVAPGSAGPS